MEFRAGLQTTESPAESRRGPCKGVPRSPLTWGSGEVRVAEANGQGKDAFLLAVGNASSSEKRERFEKVTMGPLGPRRAHEAFLAF